MKSLRKYVEDSENKKIALGHFNVSNLEMLNGIYMAAKELDLPIIIGVSEGEEKFIGQDNVSTIIRNIREKDNYPIFLNADHHYSFQSIKSAIDSGYDSVIIDAVNLPLEENINLTKECVSYAKDIKNKEGREILIEAEIGFIGKSSIILDKLPDGVGPETMTKPEEAKYFAEQTGIDLLAPAVGNIHGMIKEGNPKLDIERIKSIKESCHIPLVLHGGSGLTDNEFKEAINAGISIIHINTEIRLAYKKALEQTFKDKPEEIRPYKYLDSAVLAVKEVVLSRLKLFNNIE